MNPDHPAWWGALRAEVFVAKDVIVHVTNVDGPAFFPEVNVDIVLIPAESSRQSSRRPGR
jgi:hypothetical protein